MQDKPLFPFGPFLFLGDSVTAGWTAQNPPLFSGPQAVGRGIAGQSVRDTARRLRSEIALYGAKGLHLLCGRDDILDGARTPTLDGIVADIAAMLRDTSDLYVRTWVGSIAPVDPAAPGAAGRPIALIGAVNGSTLTGTGSESWVGFARGTTSNSLGTVVVTTSFAFSK